MERYKAVEYLLDCLAERPSWEEEIVFCREIGTKEDEEEVEVLDILDAEGIIVATDIAYETAE